MSEGTVLHRVKALANDSRLTYQERAALSDAAVLLETSDCERAWRARIEYLFRELPFRVRHRWGGDAHEFVEGIDAALAHPRAAVND